jgi:uncharacterized protein (DUF58 family)
VKNSRGTVERGGQFLLSAGVPVLFLFYFFTPQRPVQFIALFLILLVLGSKAYSEYLLRSVRLVRRDSELRVWRHGWTNVELWLENSGRLPAFLLVAADSSGGVAVFRNIKGLFTLGGRSRQIFRWEAYGSERGVFDLGPARLRGADPLGLFSFVIVFEETARLFVYPAPAFAAIKSPGGISLGNLLTTDPFNEDLTRRRSLRDYVPGDDSRRINWKASVKNSSLVAAEKNSTLGSLLVNEYELSLSYPLILFLNVDPEEYSLKKRDVYIERVIEAAAALCLMAARERQTLGLILHTASAVTSEAAGGGVISPAAFTLIPVLERLAALKPFETESGRENNRPVSAEPARGELRPSAQRLLEKGKTLPFGTRLVYAGPALDEQDYHALETLKRRRLSLEFLVIDENDLGPNLPPGVRKNSSPKYQMKDTGFEIL